MDISYQLKDSALRRDVPFVPLDKLFFGKTFSDHMFLMDIEEGEQKNPRIVPFGPITLMPNASIFQYAPTIFEGVKAFEHPNNELYTFRLKQNARRFNQSAVTMQMPEILEDDQIEAVHALLDVDRLWFPQQENASLYIRPFMFASEEFLGVRPSTKFTYCIMLSPSGPYYQSGLNPTTMWMTHSHKRAFPMPGRPMAKAGAWYGLSLLAKAAAKANGAEQSLYLSLDNNSITEVGSMNHFHVKDGDVIYPKFTSEILESITTRSIVELSENSRLPFKVKPETINPFEFIQQLLAGSITEAGGFGTAAVVSPVGKYIIEKGMYSENDEVDLNLSEDRLVTVGDGNVGPLTLEMRAMLSDIQYGKIEPPQDWLELVERR